jgi:hypothetical protein
MSFLRKIFKKKKSAPAIKKAVAVSSAYKTPIVISKVPISSNIKRQIISPFMASTKNTFAPVQLPKTDLTTKLTRAPYVPKVTVKSTSTPVKTPIQTVVKTPTIATIKPFVSQIKSFVAPVEKVVLPVSTSTSKIAEQINSISTNNSTMMQKIQDFVKLHTWKLLIPVALIIGVVIYLKKGKRTIKRK